MIKIKVEGTVYQLVSDIKFRGGTSDCYILRKVGMGNALQPLFYLFKKLKPSVAANCAYRGLLKREYQLGRSLQNMNVVGYKEYIEAEQGIVMNYVSGCTLEEFLTADAAKAADAAYFGRNGLCRVAKFCFQILSGLKAMHDRRFFHCDITSRNILMTDVTLDAVIIDLGMAHCMGDGALLGTTNHCCAPEMQAGKADGRSDIFMFGQILQRITSSLPVFASIVARCTAPDPESRFQSVDDVAAAILNLCASEQNVTQTLLLHSYYITCFPQPYSCAV